MFIEITDAKNIKVLINMTYITEIKESDGSNEDVNTVLFSVKTVNGHSVVFEAQETYEEIVRRIG